MNYLAHAYLSFGHPQILVGNMISDFVKGKKQFDLPESIQKGIRLHRDIDQFTDTHFAVHEAMKVFRPSYRLYAAPIVDIIFDHFVAISAFSKDELKDFSQQVYRTLDDHRQHLPEKFAAAFIYMKEYNWLQNYQFNWGIERSLAGLHRRARFLTESNEAYELFLKHYYRLQHQFGLFFGDVKNFAKQQLQLLVL